jgi:hypothetical protein
VEEEILPGDVEASDVIVLPGSSSRLRVLMIRLGQGGFILTVVPADGGPAPERTVTLTAYTRLRRQRSAAGRTL